MSCNRAVLSGFEAELSDQFDGMNLKERILGSKITEMH